MRLRFTPAASADIDAILSFLEEHSPQGARRTAERLDAAINMLLLNPRLGRRTSKSGVRRLVLARQRYLVFYTLRGDELVVVGVRHGARRPETMPGDWRTPYYLATLRYGCSSRLTTSGIAFTTKLAVSWPPSDFEATPMRERAA